MIEVHILIPERGNDGALFSAAHHVAFESELLQLFGGFSLFANPAPVMGRWRSAAGVVYTDTHRIYVVFLVSMTNGGDLGTAVATAKAHYGQDSVAIRYLGLAEIL